jgi:hypothetical protein
MKRSQKALSNSVEDDAFLGLGIWGVISLSAAVLGTYHGYRRDNSIGWALGWGFFGATVPVIALPLMFAEGFAEPIQPGA